MRIYVLTQEDALYIPRITQPSPPQAEVAALRETAKLLVNAEHPVIFVDRVAEPCDDGGEAPTWLSRMTVDQHAIIPM